MLGANMGFQRDYTKTKVFTNLLHQARAFCPLTDGGGYGYSNVALKGNGYPVAGASCIVVFLSNLTADDAGQYLVSVRGDFTGSASIQQAGGGTLGARVYNASTGKTTCTLTCTGAGDSFLALRFNNCPPDMADLEVMCPEYAPGTAQLIRTEVLAHLAPFRWLRFMDWLETNGPEFPEGDPNGDTDWATSRAANEGTPLGYKHSLKACFDLAGAAGAAPWTNIPVSATDAYITSYVARGLQLLPADKKWRIEFGNEVWNPQFPAYATSAAAAFAAANVRAGSADIASCSKAGGTATLVLKGADHGRTAGQQVYVQGINNITGGLVTLTAGTSGKTLTWDEAGTATGTLRSEWQSCVFLSPNHALCAQVSGGWWTPEYPTAYYVKLRYELTRVRAIWAAALAAGATSRIEVVQGAWLAQFFNNMPLLTWAYQQYGGLSWLHSLCPAFYADAENNNAMTTVDAVFAELEANWPNVAQRAQHWANVLASWGLPMPAYEGGPHTHIKTSGTQAAVAAAHSDDRMRLFIKKMLQDWCDRGGKDFAYYYAGSNNTFGGTGNNTWALVLGDITTGPTQAKYQAMTQTGAAPFLPEAVAGLNSGAIRFVDALPGGFIGWPQNQQFIVTASSRIPDVAVHIAAPVDGTYTVALDAGATAAGCLLTLLVDDVPVDSGNAPEVNVYGALPGEALSAAVTLAAGQHVVKVRLASTPRPGAVGLYRVRVAPPA